LEKYEWCSKKTLVEAIRVKTIKQKLVMENDKWTAIKKMER
jgi:hypothetical protein